MKTGLYFGSFNPIHIGHMAIANFFVEFTDLRKLWFIVSPHNPLKQKSSLLDDYQRLELVNRAIGKSDKYFASDIEFRMPQPSYTIDTLTYLSDKFKKHEFVLIMGEDNLQTLHKWKNYKQILQYYEIYVYPRPGYKREQFADHPGIRDVDAPVMEISSSFIRNAIKDGKEINHFLHPEVYKYIKEMRFYK
jgi:nicotinate-nucleotide adenylyltransferase